MGSYAVYPSLSGRNVFITGGASGIGESLVEAFVRQQARVAFIDLDLDAAQGLQKRLKDENFPEPWFEQCDVRDISALEKCLRKAASDLGPVSVLVNNAGIAEFKPMLETTYEEWSRILAVNLNGPFICSQACAPFMLKNEGGSIVNIASISGLRASTLRIAYGTSKAALMHLTKQQAAELGNKGVRVNAIAPGPVDTAMAKKVHTADIRSDYYDVIPLNRYGLEEEIADAVWFLCSDSASYINGQIIAADGGFDATGIGLTSLRQSKN